MLNLEQFMCELKAFYLSELRQQIVTKINCRGIHGRCAKVLSHCVTADPARYVTARCRTASYGAGFGVKAATRSTMPCWIRCELNI